MSLKCGHIFGQRCIETWIVAQRKHKCPQCNAKATKGDIRLLYNLPKVRWLSNIRTVKRFKAAGQLYT